MLKAASKNIRKGVVLVLSCAALVVEAQYLNPPVKTQPASRRDNGVVDMPTFRRELTHVNADMRVLQEDIKLLATRLVALESEKQAKDALIHELQETLALYERRFQKMERDQAQLEARLRQELQQSQDRVQAANQKNMENLQNAMAGEISRVERVAVKAANASARTERKPVLTGSYKEVRVEKGDTLSGLAAASGVSVSTLRQVNGLTDNNIRIGQTLKVPVPQP